MPLPTRANSGAALEDGEEEEEEMLLGAAATQSSANGKGAKRKDGGGGDDATGFESWPIQVTSSRLVPLLHTPGHVRGGTAMRWFAAISSQLGSNALNGMLSYILGPVARAAEDESGKVHPQVKELASEALQLLQRRAEAPLFVAAYQKVKEEQKAIRRARKQREAVEAVSDPGRAAQKRIAKNLGKRKAKKRKLEVSKRTRDSGGSIGLGSKKKARRLTVENN